MTDRPIIFSAPMVLALLAGRKTQTRRLALAKRQRQGSINPAYADELRAEGWHVTEPDDGDCCYAWRDPPSPWQLTKAGDRLWVREAWSPDHHFTGLLPRLIPPEHSAIWYWADGNPEDGDWTKPKPSIHMPRWASRLTLTVTDVRVQRLQEISAEDADAEVFGGDFPHQVMPELFSHPEAGSLSIPECFGRLWNSLHGDGAWEANPFVAAITFTVDRRNIDAPA